MRILVISQYFDPEPVLCGLPFAKEFVRQGHEVEVLTGFPHYRLGRIYPGYKLRFFQKETMDGIKVNRCWVYPSHDRSSVKRFMTYASFGISGAFLGPWVVDKADIAFVYSPPVTVWLPAWTQRLLRNIPFAYNIQDLWPDALASSTMVRNKLALRVADQCCRFLYKHANCIVAQSPGIKAELCKRGIPESKIEVIYNWCNDSVLKPAAYDPFLANELGMAGKFNVLFAGGMGTGQALAAVLDAANILKDQSPEIQFVFIGDGVEKDYLKQKAKRLLLKNVIFHDPRPQSEIGPILCLADVLLVHLKDNFLHEITIPSKIQAYLNVGKPILIGATGDSADLVAKAKAGIRCEPENPQNIAEAVLKLWRMPKEELARIGQNGCKYYNQELSLETAVKRYVQVFHKIAR